jgi:hypothetical protein
MTVVMFKFFPVSLEEMEKKAAEKERIARAKNPNKFIEQRTTTDQNSNSNKKTQRDYIQQRPKK